MTQITQMKIGAELGNANPLTASANPQHDYRIRVVTGVCTGLTGNCERSLRTARATGVRTPRARREEADDTVALPLSILRGIDGRRGCVYQGPELRLERKRPLQQRSTRLTESKLFS